MDVCHFRQAEGVMVGSIECSQCEHNLKFDFSGQSIICKLYERGYS